MVVRPASLEDREVIRSVLAFQFEPRFGEYIAGLQGLEVELSSKGRLRYVRYRGERLLTRRAGDGLFSLSLIAGGILRDLVEPPRFRVIVREPEVVGNSVLAVIVAEADPCIRPGDEVVIVDLDDNLVGVGRARVSGRLMTSLERGEVVRARRLASRAPRGGVRV